MAKNGPTGKGREGMVDDRTQFQNPNTGLWIKRNSENGRFMDVKTTSDKFKGVRKEK
ncbi:MAG: hypothetical protein NTY75_00850 [Candidatus Shapirobacteria bacterium]|nr:hypothetical protein [Candidatus Shapirobacteria bacterium]